jgi:hypothetical protein
VDRLRQKKEVYEERGETETCHAVIIVAVSSEGIGQNMHPFAASDKACRAEG